MSNERYDRTAIVKTKFISAATKGDYRKALLEARRLRGPAQLMVLDALFDAARRLGLTNTVGLPRVREMRTITVRGKDVLVES